MTDKQPTEPAKLVVNTNLGLTNVMRLRDVNSIITDTLNVCKDRLFAHCGPYSRYAMLLNGFTAGESFEPSLFTRDGIRILSAIEFVSPVERYIQELLTYVGGRVDNYAKDGTTTSMLITAEFISALLNDYIYSSTMSPLAVISEINKVTDSIIKREIVKYCWNVDRIVSKMKEVNNDESNVTEADEIKAASIIAYMQALSSSGGNVQLAECVREIFACSPKVAWDFIGYQNNPKESEVPYSVFKPEYDIKFKASLATASSNIFNKGLGTEYEYEDVRCIIDIDGLIPMAFNTMQMMQYVNDYPVDKPLMIVSPSIDPTIVREIDELNHKRVIPIALWQYMSDMRIRNNGLDFELQVTNAICGCTPYKFRDDMSARMSDEYTFVAKRVHFFGGYIHIYDTAPRSENSCLHPYYEDRTKATKYYNELRDDIEKYLSMYDNNARSETQMRNYLIETLNRLACIQRPMLYVGGTVHDQVANADVVQDVLGAVMSSLKHGFYINGVWSFVDDLQSAKSDTLVGKALHHAAMCVWDHLYKPCEDHYYTLDVGSYKNILAESKSNIEFFIKDPDEHVKYNNYPILHPIGIYTELLKRLNELAIKFTLSDEIIVRGGVVMPEDKK